MSSGEVVAMTCYVCRQVAAPAVVTLSMELRAYVAPAASLTSYVAPLLSLEVEL